MVSKSTVDVDQRYVRSVDAAVSRGAARFGCGRFAVHPDRGGCSPCRVGWVELDNGDAGHLVLSRCRGRAVRAADRGQLGAGVPLCDGHPRQVSPRLAFFVTFFVGDEAQTGWGARRRMFILRIYLSRDFISCSRDSTF